MREARHAGVLVLGTVAGSLLGAGALDFFFSGTFLWLTALSRPEVSIVTSVIVPIVLVLLAITVSRLPAKIFVRTIWAVILGGIAFIAWLVIVTNDASVSAQLYFLLPVMYAAYAFRQIAAWCALVCAEIAHAVALANVSGNHSGAADFITLCLISGGMLLVIAWLRDAYDAASNKLRELALIDSLTGLYRRSALDQLLGATAHDANDGGEALLVIDIDKFKGINDEFGHPAGDLALRSVAAQLQVIAEHGGTACRLGGDELAVYLPACSLADAQAVGVELVERVNQMEVCAPDGRVMPITVSIGVAHWPTHSHSVEGLYGAADRGAYLAKQRGQNQLAVAEPGAA